MEKEKCGIGSENFMTNQDNYMNAFRNNVERYAKEHRLTIRSISEMADVSFSTLNSFLYGNVKDCKLSTAIKLARAFDVTLDELVGAGTMKEEERESLNIVRSYPERTKYIVRWLLKYHKRIMEEHIGEKYIHMLKPKLQKGEGIYFASSFEILNITSVRAQVAEKTFMAMQLPGNAYMPKYAPEDILLIGKEGYGESNVDYIVVYNHKIYLTKKCTLENEKYYVDIANTLFRIPMGAEERVIGYVVGVLSNETGKIRTVVSGV